MALAMHKLLSLGGPFENGSHAAFADGSVRFLSQEHSPETLAP